METPRKALFLHVGLPKTGTTQLQGVLWANRRLLADRGLLYPGRKSGAHWTAARDLLNSRAPEVRGAWQSLVDEIHASSAPSVVVSHEMLAALTGKQVTRVIDDFADRDVHLVLTLRDFSRVVSATWQERAKNREVEPWPEFLSAVAAGPAGGHRFWRLQDAPRVLELWSQVIPAERIHVVTVPPLNADRLLLLRRFTQVLGVDPTDLVIPRPEANQSLGAVEIAVLQRLNVATADLDVTTYRRRVKNFVVPKLLARRPDQVRVVLPEEARPWVTTETDRIRRSVERLGCEVVGGVDDLDPTAIGMGAGGRVTASPHLVSPDDVLDASAQLVAELLDRDADLRGRLARERTAPTAPDPGTGPGRAGRISDLVRRVRRVRNR